MTNETSLAARRPASLATALAAPALLLIAFLSQVVAGVRDWFAQFAASRPTFGPADFDFSDLATDAPAWLEQLTERND